MSSKFDGHQMKAGRVFVYPLRIILLMMFALLLVVVFPRFTVLIGLESKVAVGTIIGLAMCGVPLIFSIFYMVMFSIIVKSDHMVIKGFKKRRILFCDIASVEVDYYKGLPSGVVMLRNGGKVVIGGGIGNFREAMALINRSIT
ncbi:MAG: hypothetical protein ACREPQ_12420 [Rhodanobacter sp.]